jgi:hypothetical protein
MLAQGIVNL